MSILGSCSNFKKATDLVTNPSPKEQYKRDLKVSDELFELWKNQVDLAFRDSLKVTLPYYEKGNFNPRSFPVYSYEVVLNAGEKLDFQVETDSVNDMVFIELFRLEGDSIRSYKKIKSSKFRDRALSTEIDQPGIYKLVVQPEIEANTPFVFKIKKSPVYAFPVLGGKNTTIQSLWGAIRDGGKRNHEGIDIFAPRGTPVIAVTDGRITSSGEKGLGGKQVWLRDSRRGQSLYYAHLDSIAPLGNRKVKAGDTLGFVGNTGNARTTPPHLHFGIYKRGAINPLFHVFQIEDLNLDAEWDSPEISSLLVNGEIANLRNLPTTKNSEVIGNSKNRDTLQFLGKTWEWFHVRTSAKQAAFIHESLVVPL